MDSFGTVLGTVIAEIIVLIEGTLSHYVVFTTDGENITNISLSPVGDAFCLNWSNLLVSFAGALNGLMTALWTLST
jgi:hypothetical protein